VNLTGNHPERSEGISEEMSVYGVQPQNDSPGESCSFRRFLTWLTGVIQIFTFFPLQ